jgi:hypothetical protein
VLKTWVEDFVDEDTGEVVSIERNEVIIDRETVLENEHIDQIVDSGAKTILLHKETKTSLILRSSIILYKKIHVTLKKKLFFIFTDSYVTQNHLMKLQLEM